MEVMVDSQPLLEQYFIECNISSWTSSMPLSPLFNFELDTEDRLICGVHRPIGRYCVLENTHELHSGMLSLLTLCSTTGFILEVDWKWGNHPVDAIDHQDLNLHLLHVALRDSMGREMTASTTMILSLLTEVVKRTICVMTPASALETSTHCMVLMLTTKAIFLAAYTLIGRT